MTERRCDKSMKRSKEQAHFPDGKRWKCSGDCEYCFCCIIKLENGDEEHVDIRRIQK